MLNVLKPGHCSEINKKDASSGIIMLLKLLLLKHVLGSAALV